MDDYGFGEYSNLI